MRGSITRKLGLLVAALALPVLAIGTAGAVYDGNVSMLKSMADLISIDQ